MPDLLRQSTELRQGSIDTVGGKATFEVDSSSIVPNAVSGSISYRVLADGSTVHTGYDRITVYDESYGTVFSDYTIPVSYNQGDASYDGQGVFPTDLAAGSYLEHTSIDTVAGIGRAQIEDFKIWLAGRPGTGAALCRRTRNASG